MEAEVTRTEELLETGVPKPSSEGRAQPHEVEPVVGCRQSVRASDEAAIGEWWLSNGGGDYPIGIGNRGLPTPTATTRGMGDGVHPLWHRL